MAHTRLTQATAARDAFGKGAEIVEKKLPKLDSGDLGNLWQDVIIANMLMREAQALIRPTGAAGTDDSKRDW